MTAAAAFLFKTEPSAFSFEMLEREQSALWDGVTNAAALIHLRTVRRGNAIFIYHTGDEKSVVGLARATADASEDPNRPGKNDRGEPKFAVVRLEPLRRLRAPVSLATIKADARFQDFGLVRQTRLSVMPVPPALAKAMLELGG